MRALLLRFAALLAGVLLGILLAVAACYVSGWVLPETFGMGVGTGWGLGVGYAGFVGGVLGSAWAGARAYDALLRRAGILTPLAPSPRRFWPGRPLREAAAFSGGYVAGMLTIVVPFVMAKLVGAATDASWPAFLILLGTASPVVGVIATRAIGRWFDRRDGPPPAPAPGPPAPQVRAPAPSRL